MHLIPAGLCKASRVYPVKDSNSTEKYVVQRGQVENEIIIMTCTKRSKQVCPLLHSHVHIQQQNGIIPMYFLLDTNTSEGDVKTFDLKIKSTVLSNEDNLFSRHSLYVDFTLFLFLQNCLLTSQV